MATHPDSTAQERLEWRLTHAHEYTSHPELVAAYEERFGARE